MASSIFIHQSSNKHTVFLAVSLNTSTCLLDTTNMSPRLENITQDQIRQVLNQHPESDARSKAENFEYDENHNLKYNRNFGLRLYASVQDPVGHFSRIDRTFASVVIGRFNTVGKHEDKSFASKDVVCITLFRSL